MCHGERNKNGTKFRYLNEGTKIPRFLVSSTPLSVETVPGLITPERAVKDRFGLFVCYSDGLYEKILLRTVETVDVYVKHYEATPTYCIHASIQTPPLQWWTPWCRPVVLFAPRVGPIFYFGL